MNDGLIIIIFVICAVSVSIVIATIIMGGHIVSSADFELLQEIKGEGSHTNPLYRLGEKLGYYSKEKAMKICDSFGTTAIFQMGISECVSEQMPKPQPKAEDMNAGVFRIEERDVDLNSSIFDTNISIFERDFPPVCFFGDNIIQEQFDYWEVYMKTEMPVTTFFPVYWRFHKDLYSFDADKNCFEAK